MRDLPVSSFAFVWTPTGPKIVRTDDCGDVIDMSSLKRARSKQLPESLMRLVAASRPAPDSGAGPLN